MEHEGVVRSEAYIKVSNIGYVEKIMEHMCSKCSFTHVSRSDRHSSVGISLRVHLTLGCYTCVGCYLTVLVPFS